MSRDERKVVVRGPVCSSSAVTGWFSQDFSNGTAAEASTARPREVDVHGFAFNSSVLWDPERWGRYPTSEPDKSQVSHLSTLHLYRVYGTAIVYVFVCPINLYQNSKRPRRLSLGSVMPARLRRRSTGFGHIERGISAMKAAFRLSAS